MKTDSLESTKNKWLRNGARLKNSVSRHAFSANDCQGLLALVLRLVFGASVQALNRWKVESG